MDRKKVIIKISENFPSYHTKYGEKTYFEDKILNKTKKHTIRSNYDYWYNKYKNNYILSVCKWCGKPYRSKIIHIIDFYNWYVDKLIFEIKEGEIITQIDNRIIPAKEIAKNDGFDNTEDFFGWFKKDFKTLYVYKPIIYFDINYKY